MLRNAIGAVANQMSYILNEVLSLNAQESDH